MTEQWFRNDNTQGYSPVELDALNAELAQRLRGIEAGTDQYHEIVKSFIDEVARR